MRIGIRGRFGFVMRNPVSKGVRLESRQIRVGEGFVDDLVNWFCGFPWRVLEPFGFKAIGSGGHKCRCPRGWVSWAVKLGFVKIRQPSRKRLLRLREALLTAASRLFVLRWKMRCQAA